MPYDLHISCQLYAQFQVIDLPKNESILMLVSIFSLQLLTKAAYTKNRLAQASIINEIKE
ncbi:hypothetical protein VDP25_11015 [Winogradskyella sp. ECml5-4]|uniref:hypothetical protein n=1 Tax=Winogradskyella sp. ECml5-4 TaxID=3110975 RepID=UPI002FF2B859